MPLLDSRTDLDSVPGWFFPTDRALFRWILDHQTASGQRGGLVEIGVYFGKSAIVMADHRATGESFTVLDLFEGDADDESNAAENRSSYGTLTRQGFEEQYTRFHEQLPDVVVGLSSIITERVPAGSARFVHIDASHLYEHVVGDIASAQQLLQPEGIVAFDDYRSPHTPGVAAAVWDAVLHGGLRPVCISDSKLYGTWGSPDAIQEALYAHLARTPESWRSIDVVAGHRIVRCTIS